MNEINEKKNSELDIYYIGYNMMIQALKHENIYEGLKKALYLAKIFIEAEDLVLFKKEDNGEYTHYSNSALMDNNSKLMSTVLNKAKHIIEKKEFFKFATSFRNEPKNIIFIPISFKDSEYVISITNPQKNIKDDNNAFIQILKECFSVILDKLELYDYMQKIGTIDELTGLDNRVSYNKKINEIRESSNYVVYGLFDLFRLKFINDNYSHLHGDKYIIGAANILKKYFPKYQIITNENGAVEKRYTGTCIYRIGGDEFALITTSETLDEVLIKAQLANEEIQFLDLSVNATDEIDNSVKLGINHGIVERNNNQTTKELYLEADKFLSQNKAKMYDENRIERRK